ncbi:hypothetical protein CMQ_8030 [Grosmannia clavigera kw1407]|uniref:Uncharacterized protein n=1 Tax=Grosmannia clavigera (strain kw1407 / UAMH 11150) TaxID=655863 RepID=F0XRL8_GROCL|nr:uncharacterized protein CMQ_8030 [Grosmannia clavigera kw1407]EFW99672.1 hypothetical protein CMQ_8030 [Grosmannia clavigera kw1407]
MGHVEAGVAIAMPQSLFDGNEEDDRDNNTGLALAACYTLLRFTTDGTGNDHTTGGAWFKPAPEGTTQILLYSVEDWNRAYVALRSYIDRRVGHQVLFPTVTPKLAVTPVAFLRIRDAEGIISSEKGARLHANEEAVAEAEADDIIADNMGNELALMSEATNLLKHLQAQHRLDGTVPRDPMDMGTLEEVRLVAQAIADGQVPAAAADDNGDRTNSEETSAFLDALNTKAAISGTIQESATVHDAAASEGRSAAAAAAGGAANAREKREDLARSVSRVLNESESAEACSLTDALAMAEMPPFDPAQPERLKWSTPAH